MVTLDTYFRKKVKLTTDTILKVSANDWSIHDNPDTNKMVIKMFATTQNGETIIVNILNAPTCFFYIKLTPDYRTLLTKYHDYLFVSECNIVEKIPFFGFNGNKPEKFLKLMCRNLSRFNKLRFTLMKKDYELFESNLNPLLRFFHYYDLQPCGFFEIDSFAVKVPGHTQMEINITPSCIKIIDSWERKILQGSYDIECYSRDNSFPKPDIKENVITHLSTTFTNFNGSIFNVTLSLNTNVIDSNKFDYPVFHEVYDDEASLLRRWFALLVKIDPDILYQYNGDQFDGNYIYIRAKKHGLLMNFGKLISETCTLNKTSFSSSAYGTTYYNRLIIPGRIHFDVMIYMNRNFKEDSYSLQYISEKYLKTGKNDVTVIEMFNSYRNKDYELSKKVAEYCIKDTILPQMLIDHFNIFQAQVSMANVCYVPFNYLIYRGQQIKVFSQICKFTNDNGYLVNQNVIDENEGSFVGATVLEPDRGLYHDPIAVLDFASLYPSIIRAHNLCYSTVVLDSKYLDLPEFTYSTFNNVTFVQNVSGILPEILSKMAVCRKTEKMLMKQAKTPLEKTIHDMNQNAYKVSMNSLYGFLAANMLTCKYIASTVTFVGREMIEKTSRYVETTFSESNTKVIYGDTDSVFINFNKDYNETKKLGYLAAEGASKLFKSPIKLEFEKIYYPFLLFSKKRYAGLYHNIDTDASHLDSKGIVIKRRDNCKLLRDIYGKLLDLIMSKDFTKHHGMTLIHDFIIKLKSGDYPIESLSITKTIRDNYKNTNLPHLIVAEQMKQRGLNVQVNERIPYVFIKKPGLKITAPQYQRAEHLEHAKDFNLQIDYDYYIQKQFLLPLTQILELFCSVDEINNVFMLPKKKPRKKASNK